MNGGGALNYEPDLMPEEQKSALMNALLRFLVQKKHDAWPAAYQAEQDCKGVAHHDIDVVVLPLDRIGAPPGASGAKVFIAYYADRRKSSVHIQPSPPFVVKLGASLDLRAEEKVPWPTLGDNAENFALPCFLHEDSPELAVLIAPFRSGFEPNADGRRHSVQVKDIWTLLNSKDELVLAKAYAWRKTAREIGTQVGHALEYISRVHRASRGTLENEKLDYSACYGRHLRSTHPDVPGRGKSRKHVPERLFGQKATVSAFGSEWPNPTRILGEIVKGADNQFSGIAGPVHGDLHPKNIVISRDGVVRIIDFGWAHRQRHVVADYVLLDINIRAMTLPSQLSQSDVLEIASFHPASKDFARVSRHVRPRARIIQEVIWAHVRDKKVVTDWHREYLIPFFFVAYGLLVHLDSARNQAALIATVLAAAKEIERRSHGY